MILEAFDSESEQSQSSVKSEWMLERGAAIAAGASGLDLSLEALVVDVDESELEYRESLEANYDDDEEVTLEIVEYARKHGIEKLIKDFSLKVSSNN